jgi:type II secretory pathway pseudopilin PulG
MVEATGQSRFQISITTLMIAIALCAVFLALVAWTNRRIREERLLAQLARDQAEQARYLAQFRSAQAAFSAAKLGNTPQFTEGSLWAALTVNHSTFKQRQTKSLRIEFSLVNDGRKAIDPKIADSRFIPVHWGDRWYLVPNEAGEAFCDDVKRGREPRKNVHGHFYLREGDFKKKVSGLPTVPKEWETWFQKTPIEQQK